MSRLYADEQIPYRIVECLRALGHDVLTVQEANNRGQSDEDVLAFATSTERVVLTFNRRHFIRCSRNNRTMQELSFVPMIRIESD